VFSLSEQDLQMHPSKGTIKIMASAKSSDRMNEGGMATFALVWDGIFGNPHNTETARGRRVRVPTGCACADLSYWNRRQVPHSPETASVSMADVTDYYPSLQGPCQEFFQKWSRKELPPGCDQSQGARERL
jgi:hypothetical protein